MKTSLLTAAVACLTCLGTASTAQDLPFDCYLGSGYEWEPEYEIQGWIGGAPGAWDAATAETYIDISHQVPSNTIFVYFMSVSAGVDIRLEAANRGTDTNGVATISQGADGWTKAHAADDGRFTGGRDERPLPAGNYCLFVESDEHGPADVLVRVGRSDQTALTTAIPDEMRALTRCDQAVPFGELGTSRMITASQTPDVYFDLPTEGRVTITADSFEAQPEIDLHGINDHRVWPGDGNGIEGYERIVHGVPIDAGRYCIFSTAENPDVPFEMTIALYDPAEIATHEYNEGREVPPLDSGHPITDFGDSDTVSVAVGRDVSWLVFTQEERGRVVITATAPDYPGADIPMKLYNAEGYRVSQGLGTFEEYDYGSEYGPILLPGTYRIGVGHFQAGEVVDIEVVITGE